MHAVFLRQLGQRHLLTDRLKRNLALNSGECVFLFVIPDRLSFVTRSTLTTGPNFRDHLCHFTLEHVAQKWEPILSY
jgi:hypothetical protein